MIRNKNVVPETPTRADLSMDSFSGSFPLCRITRMHGKWLFVMSQRASSPGSCEFHHPVFIPFQTCGQSNKTSTLEWSKKLTSLAGCCKQRVFVFFVFCFFLDAVRGCSPGVVDEKRRSDHRRTLTLIYNAPAILAPLVVRQIPPRGAELCVWSLCSEEATADGRTGTRDIRCSGRRGKKLNKKT